MQLDGSDGIPVDHSDGLLRDVLPDPRLCDLLPHRPLPAAGPEPVGTIAVSLGLYLLFELLWQVVERRWGDVWVLILGTLALSCLLGFLAAWAWGKLRGREPNTD